jgi:hypothetical protein
MKIYKGMICLLILLITAFSLYAETGASSDTSLSLIISTLPEAKFIFTQSFTIPFLQGENPLVSGNNIRFNLKTELTPISMNFISEAVLTPIAFLQFAAGGLLGSGWNIELFGSPVFGIGVNQRGQDGNTAIYGPPFNGMFTKGYFGGAFQFDMAAIFPGDWNHVVVRSYHEVNYMSYGRAAPGEAWVYENDHAENQNGWNYYGNYLVGYQMPIFLDTVALLAEMYKYLYNAPNGDLWGDALGRWELSLVTNFTVTKSFSVALITQFRTLRKYNEYNYEKGEDKVFYQDRTLQDGNSRRVAYYRIAAIMQYKFGVKE